MIARPTTSKFRGLNNVTDPLRLASGWLTQADNVDITDRLQLQRAQGFTRSTTNTAITGAYATLDRQRLYVVDSGELRQLHTTSTYTVLATGLASARMHFEEVAGKVFYTNGVDFGVIEPGGVRTWGTVSPDPPVVTVQTGSLEPGTYQVVCTLVDALGLESSNSDVLSVAPTAAASLRITSIPQVTGYTTNVYVTATDGTVFFQIAEAAGTEVHYDAGHPLGMELPFFLTDPPRGTLPAAFRGHMYVADPFPQHDMTVAWCSLALHYHHFDRGEDAFVVPGVVNLLAACAEALIVGTERGIYAYDGAQLTELAPYGTVPGYGAVRLGTDLFFWTTRGLCTAMPFRNLTASTISVAPGLAAGAAVLERDGIRRYVVALQAGGTAFNRRTS